MTAPRLDSNPVPTNPHHQAALAFAAALDRENYLAARPFLADDCLYVLRDQEIRGADEIIASYRSHGEAARKRFDQVAYQSDIEMTGQDSAIVHFTDIVTHHRDQHTHRCRQHLQFDQSGLVASIVHEDLDGEADRLAEFKERHP